MPAYNIEPETTTDMALQLSPDTLLVCLTWVLPSSCVDISEASSLVAPSRTGSGALLLLMSAAGLGTACAKWMRLVSASWLWRTCNEQWQLNMTLQTL
jgi:hypothetical protein